MYIYMGFEWDEGKNRSNQVKHKVSFDSAALVFQDPHAISVLDRVEDGEEALRKATPRERPLYEENL